MLLNWLKMKKKSKIRSKEFTGETSLLKRRTESRRRLSKKKPRFHSQRRKQLDLRMARMSLMTQSSRLAQSTRLRTSSR